MPSVQIMIYNNAANSQDLIVFAYHNADFFKWMYQQKYEMLVTIWSQYMFNYDIQWNDHL